MQLLIIHRQLFFVAIVLLAISGLSLAGKIRAMSNRAVKKDWIIDNPPTLVADDLYAIEDQDYFTCIDVLSNDVDTDWSLDLDETTIILFSYPNSGSAYIEESTFFVCYK